ncbi:hypothetical protein EZV62_015230 [Acer yangbiense]|uniref:Uncharacterized protein n=1 Tax=Acer yangbiense TaxID=1000413 RepID=A0A5C7HU71_9ROSI|nr:hypothetical protein EZV62_015230 [Acer yangbiense]
MFEEHGLDRIMFEVDESCYVPSPLEESSSAPNAEAEVLDMECGYHALDWSNIEAEMLNYEGDSEKDDEGDDTDEDVYINSKKTIVEGRRISTSKACENPTCVEIGDTAVATSKSHLQLSVFCLLKIDKAYPRDFMQRGRVRALLKRENGTLFNPAISSRKPLMLHVAELVPRHPGRTKKQESASTSSAAAAGPSSKSGKGGKKNR